MTTWLCVLSLIYATYASTPEVCSCTSGTLSHSYEVAHDVFSGNVLGTSNDGTALVLITEIFKGTYTTNDLVYIHYSCGTFPTRVGYEGVFFTNPTSNVGGTIVAHLVECTRNGAVTTDEKTQLRSKHFAAITCRDPKSGKVYKEGDSFPVDCNTCSCSKGSILCTKMACTKPPAPTSCKWNGKTILDGQSYKIDSCNTCTCHAGSLKCTEAACVKTPSTHCYDEKGAARANGDEWTTSDACIKKKCLNGIVREVQTCRNTASNTWIIAGPLLGVVVVILMVSIVTVIRRRRAMESEGILLEDVEESGSGDDNQNNNNNNGMGYSVNTYPAPQAYGNYMGSQMMYSPPAWGSQPLQTTPMVLMTQTGEPVVVQVAYM